MQFTMNVLLSEEKVVGMIFMILQILMGYMIACVKHLCLNNSVSSKLTSMNNFEQQGQ